MSKKIFGITGLLAGLSLFLTFGIISSCLYYPGGSGGNSGTSPNGCRKKINLVNGCLGPFLPETTIQREAASRGLNVERMEYAPSADNAKGECQMRYINFFTPKSFSGGKPKGLFFYFHGGGGDVGSADYTEILQSCAMIADMGYIVADIEYRRGWTGTEPLDQWCDEGRDPHDESAANYDRERDAAHLSFEDAELAVRFAYDRIKKQYGVLPTYSTGTSFGGTLASYVGYGEAKLAKEVNLKGVLNQYGGLSQKDPLYATVPYFGAGGVVDDLVPFWNGPTYVSAQGEPIYGTGGLGIELRSRGVPARILATCNTGHGRGAISERELVEDFLDWVEKPSSETTFMERSNGKALAAEPADSCNVPWQTLRAERGQKATR